MTQQGYLRRDKRSWRLVVRLPDVPGGPRRRRSIPLGPTAALKTKRDAEAAAKRWRAANLSGSFNAAMAMPWPEWCEIYLYRHAAMLAKSTWKTQAAIVRRHLAAPFEKFHVHEIDRHLAQSWVNRQHDSGASAATIAARFAVLRRMLRVAAEEGLAVVPPTSKSVRLPVNPAVAGELRRKALTIDEANRIIAAAPPIDAVAYAACLYLGLRSGELVGLTWEGVNLVTGAVTIRAQAVDGKLKTLKTRSSAAVLQAPAPLLEHLREFREDWVANDGGFLFADAKGVPWRPQALRERLRALLVQLGMPARGLHGFRHAIAFALADAGCNPEVIRRCLRHSSLRVTQIYLSASAADVAQGFERAAALIGSRANGSPRAQP
jgi:integrase